MRLHANEAAYLEDCCAVLVLDTAFVNAPSALQNLLIWEEFGVGPGNGIHCGRRYIQHKSKILSGFPTLSPRLMSVFK